MMHENPVLVRSQINTALNNLPNSNPLRTVLSKTGLADQIEMLKITPATLGREELAWLWTALKADFRPTYAFDVSVVLIENPSRELVRLPGSKSQYQRSLRASAGVIRGPAAC